MTKPHILFRCDASLLIGSGHVMRCRTLARELQRCGAQVFFLCRRQTGDLISLLEQEFTVLPLPELSLSAAEGLQGRELYSAWLGCSQEHDAADCLQSLAQAGIKSASWLVVDHYGLEATWETLMLAALTGDAAPRLLVIDDLADRPHRADLLLDQNFFGAETETRYAGLVPVHCRQLLGPHQALLGPEYAQLHPLVPPRTELRRVLVFFGGVDSENLTGRALEALMNPALADIAVDVVLGLQSTHRSAVEELVARRPYTTLHGQLPSLAGLIARADLAIGGGGATTWERCCLGLPSILVVCAHNQEGIGEAIAEFRAGVILYPGAQLSAEIRERVVNLCRDTNKYLQMSCRAEQICDGLGVSRVSKEIITTSNTGAYVQ
jgi:UDP-2,4-diacetamido-2,4,6-trideoxy-beta-L-altropyranose hydrolase